jgi:hypothetical protein
MLAALRTVVDHDDHSAPRRSGVERIDLDGRDGSAPGGSASDVAT